MRARFLVVLLVMACACGRAPLPPTTPLPSPSPQPIRPSWVVTGVVRDRSGAPVSWAKVGLLLDSWRGEYAAGTEADIAGRFTLTTDRSPGGGDLVTHAAGFARQFDRFICAPPPEVPVHTCSSGSAPPYYDLRPAKVIGITLLGPSIIAAGDNAPIRREVRLDDGRLITDDGSNGLFAVDGVYDHPSISDQAVAKIQSVAGGGSNVFGLAVGTATLTSQIKAIRAQIPVQVVGKQ